MDKEEIIKKLKAIQRGDCEVNHVKADDLLLEFIDDKEISSAFSDVEKWYA